MSRQAKRVEDLERHLAQDDKCLQPIFLIAMVRDQQHGAHQEEFAYTLDLVLLIN